jgi:steroid delta-isomerase-like uncharacterized protein
MDDLAAAWLAAWCGAGEFADCCAPDVQYEDPLASEPLRDLGALTNHARRVREALPDLQIKRTGTPLHGGPYVCIPWRAAGTHRNQVGALPPTNRFVAIHGLHYLELSDGKVRRGRGFFDLYEAATQLGIFPARGGMGESVLLLLRGFGLRSG